MASGFNKVMKAREELNVYDWYATHWDWNCGYLVLIGSSGKHKDFELDLDDNEFGVLVFTRDYAGEEWDENFWSMQVCTKDCWKNTSFSAGEMERIAKLLTALSDCKEPYTKSNETSEDMAQKRVHMERVLKSYGYEA